MKRLFLLLFSLSAIVPSGRCGYEDKPDTNANYKIEPVLAPGTPSVQLPKGQYPYYGNAPEDMLPYRNIEPYYRYFLTRMPFSRAGSRLP